jgi:hypothetical protein
MMKKWLSSFLFGLIVISSITGCNMGDNNNLEPEDVDYTPVRYDGGNDMNELDGDLDFDMQRDNRAPGEMDTPFNMDEEEPDLDEEPSEQRRGY